MQKEIMYTPFAPCAWAFLQEPKIDPKGEYPDAYQISLVLDHKEHSDLLRQISELHKAAGGTAKMGEKYHPIKPHRIKNDNDLWITVEGKYEIRFKTLAEYAPLAITTLDSQRQVIFRDKNFIANGSVVSVAWSFGNYDNKGNKGVSLYLNAVQIKELTEWSGGFNVEDSEFDKVEGYQAGDHVQVEFPADDQNISDEDLDGQDGSPVEDDLPF